MTLIVARKHNEKIYLLGDTELTFINQENKNPFIDGCLKQYIVSDNLALAFAGVREHFELFAKKLFNCTDPYEIAETSKNAQNQGNDFELIVAQNSLSNLFIIKNGKISECNSGFIGDHGGFEAFQKYFHSECKIPNPNPEDGKAVIQILRLPKPIFKEDIYQKLYISLKQVIWDSNIDGVGGVIVSLCTDQGKFKYMNYADIVTDQLKLDEFSSEPKAIEFGTPQGGGYAVEFIENSPLGGNGKEVGYYFLQGGFGIIFPENNNRVRNAKVVKAPNPAFWVLETQKILGKGITSQFITPDHCGFAGEALLKENKFEEAKFCYELQKESKQFEGRGNIKDRYFAGYATSVFNTGDFSNAIKIANEEIEKNPNPVRCKEMLEKFLQTIKEVKATDSPGALRVGHQSTGCFPGS